QQPHGDGDGVPAARSQAAEQRVLRRRIVQMKRLRIELRRERLDLGLVERMRAAREALADAEIVEREELDGSGLRHWPWSPSPGAGSASLTAASGEWYRGCSRTSSSARNRRPASAAGGCCCNRTA